MTFLGFIVAVLIIGGIFYAWYAYVHRNGVYNAAQGGDQNRQAGMQGTGQVRPTSTAMAETGTIGELEPEGKQGKYVEGAAANSGYVPRNMLNPDHGYNAETGTIGELEGEQTSFQQSVSSIQNGQQGGQQMQAQQQGQGQHNFVEKIGDVFSDLNQSIQSEFAGNGGQGQAQQMQGQQAQQGAQQTQAQAAQQVDNPQQAFAVGQNQGLALGFKQGQMAAHQGRAINGGDSNGSATPEGNIFSATGDQQAQAQLSQADQQQAQSYAQGLTFGFTHGYEQGQSQALYGQLPDEGVLPSTNIGAAAGATSGATKGATNGANNSANNSANKGGAEDLTDAIHQAFREEFYNLDGKNR